MTYSSGTISIGQAVATSSDVEFNEITTNYANNSGGVARNIYQSTSAQQVRMVQLVIMDFILLINKSIF